MYEQMIIYIAVFQYGTLAMISVTQLRLLSEQGLIPFASLRDTLA